MSAITKQYAAILFDMDGTIFDSTAAVEAHWERFGNAHGIEPALILATSHGRRTIDVLQMYAPEKATWEHVHELEAEIPRRNAEDARELPGSRTLIEAIENARGKWAIVTSGTMVLAGSWIKIMGLPEPKVFITADQVEHGKPDPSGYLLARKLLNIPPEAPVLVVEDAPAGIRAGKAANCDVLGLLTTHTREQVVQAGADFLAEDLASVGYLGTWGDGGVEIRITESSSPALPN